MLRDAMNTHPVLVPYAATVMFLAGVAGLLQRLVAS